MLCLETFWGDTGPKLTGKWFVVSLKKRNFLVVGVKFTKQFKLELKPTIKGEKVSKSSGWISLIDAKHVH